MSVKFKATGESKLNNSLVDHFIESGFALLFSCVR